MFDTTGLATAGKMREQKQLWPERFRSKQQCFARWALLMSADPGFARVCPLPLCKANSCATRSHYLQANAYPFLVKQVTRYSVCWYERLITFVSFVVLNCTSFAFQLHLVSIYYIRLWFPFLVQLRYFIQYLIIWRGKCTDGLFSTPQITLLFSFITRF